jgi:hypothetical protein
VGTPAQLVKGTTDGVRNITPLLNITRLWNGISAVALMRRGLALATDYARKRKAFGAPLSEKPLHMDTLAGLQAEAEAAFHLAFYVAELTGRAETTSTGAEAGPNSELEAGLLRLLTPVMKLTTGKQVVQVLSEVIEAFGGAGYVEDTGLPQLLRDSQVLPIWEGTTNVLSLDTLRALNLEQRAEHAPCNTFQAFKSAVQNCVSEGQNPRLNEPVRIAQSALAHAEAWLNQTSSDHTALQSGARRFSLTLGRTMELALLVKHAQWSEDHESDGRTTAAARRFANSGVDLLTDYIFDDVRALLLERQLKE